MVRLWAAIVLLAGLPSPVSSAGDAHATLLVRGGARLSMLAPGQTHAYEAALRAGEFLQVRIEQREIDVVVIVDDPTGQRLAEVDNPYGRDVPESVTLIAETDGAYRLEVRPFRSATTPGRYRLTVATWRPATAADRLRAEAVAVTNAAHRHADQRTAEGLRAAAVGYGAAGVLWRQLGDRRAEARTARRLGQTQRRLGEHDAALATLRAALTIEREDQPESGDSAGDSAGVAAVLNELGIVHRRQGDHARSIVLFQQALTIWQRRGDTAHAGRVHNNLAAALQVAGEPRRALEQYRQALAIAIEHGDRLREATAHINLGHLHDQLGEVDRAVDDFEQARRLAVAIGRRDLEADALNNLGSTLDQVGELHAALDSHGDALAVFRALGDQRRQAAALCSQGSLLIELGQAAAARQRLRQASDLLRTHPDPVLESRVLLNLGVAARDLGELDRALDLFIRAHEHSTGERDGEALSLYHQAVVRQRQGDPAAGDTLARRALTLFRAVGNAWGEVVALHARGQSAAARGFTDAARRAFTQSAERAAGIGALTEHARGQQALGRLERDVGNFEAAAAHLAQALALLESLRAEIAGDTLRASHFAAVREAFELAVDVGMLRHRGSPDAGFDRRAFALSERARARGLLDVLGRARVEVDAGDPALREQRKRLRRALNALAVQRRRRAPDGAIDAQISALTAEYRLLEGRRASPPEGEVRGLSFSAHWLDDVAVLLGPDTVLLEFALGEPRSYLWLVADGQLSSFELPGRALIEELAERLHRQLAQPTRDRMARDAALGELSRMVLGPAFDQLEKRRWVIVADGALHYVPFAVLPVPSVATTGVMVASVASVVVPLMVEHEVVHLPSLAALAQLRRVERLPASGKLAIVADPVYDHDDPRYRAVVAERTTDEDPDDELNTSDPARDDREDALARLPWSGREARAIAAEVGARVHLAIGFDANLGRATAADLGRYQAVHFATHGVLDSQHPELSGLALSRFDATGQARESFLRLHDIYRLQWHTELVVLSGCRTALGRTVRGEGLVGLARGFLHAGAAQVVASLWSVRDQATAELMRRFYQGLFHHRLTAAAALAAAQRAMWRQRRWRDPYFWAAFVLIGDWQTAGPAR